MRKVNNLSQVQLVLNQLNNAQSKFNTKPLDRAGTRITNVGAATSPTDVPTLQQVQALIQSQLQQYVPQNVQTQNHYTMIWSTSSAPAVNDLLPPYSVVSADRVGIPLYAWMSCQGLVFLTGDLSIQILLNDTPMLTNPLVLPMGQGGPVQTSDFVGNPKIGIGSLVAPTIIGAGNQTAVSIGLVIQVQGSLSLQQNNKA